MNIAFMNTALIVTWTLSAIGIAPAHGAENPDPMPGARKDECIFVRDISNWRVLDSRNVVLFTPSQRHAYLMQLSAPVSDLKYSFKVAFIDRDHDGQLCGRSRDNSAQRGRLSGVRASSSWRPARTTSTPSTRSRRVRAPRLVTSTRRSNPRRARSGARVRK